MSLDDLLKQQRTALKKRKYKKALRLLKSIEEEIDKTDAWAWLQKHEPKSYKQLIRKVEYAAEGLAQSGKSELGQLARVFTWCKDHDIELATFGLPAQLSKYHEAASWLNGIVSSGEDSAKTRKELADTFQLVRSQAGRTPPESGHGLQNRMPEPRTDLQGSFIARILSLRVTGTDKSA